jgi:hypothetical protein
LARLIENHPQNAEQEAAYELIAFIMMGWIDLSFSQKAQRPSCYYAVGKKDY